MYGDTNKGTNIKVNKRFKFSYRVAVLLKNSTLSYVQMYGDKSAFNKVDVLTL